MNQIHEIIGDGRLAFIVTTLGWGGTERYVEDLSIAYSRQGIKPLVIVDGPPLVCKARMEAAGVEVMVLDVPPDIKKGSYMSILQQALLSKRVGLIHSNQWDHFEWTQDVCIRNNIAFISTHHCTVRSPNFRQFVNFSNFRGWRKFWAHKYRAFRTSPKVISISQKSAYGLRRLWGSRVKTTTVHVGVAEMSYKANPENNGNKPVFLWAGSLIPRKRPLLMLRAFTRLIKDFPNAGLIMTGEGLRKAEAQEYVSKNLIGKVTFLGYTNEFEKIVGSAQCFVLSSADEGLPAVVLEAMSAGLPIITTDCGAVREAVVENQTGLIVPIDDEIALVEAMKKMAGDARLRKSMGAAGYERWQKYFTLDHMVNNTLKAYSILLSD